VKSPPAVGVSRLVERAIARMGKRKPDGEVGEGPAGGHGKAEGKKPGEKGGKGGKAGGKPPPKPQKKEDDGGVEAEKYKRGDRNIISVVQDKKLKMEIKRSEKSARDAAAKASRAEVWPSPLARGVCCSSMRC